PGGAEPYPESLRVNLRPHPQERSPGRVSKDGRESVRCIHPSRRRARARLLRMRSEMYSQALSLVVAVALRIVEHFKVFLVLRRDRDVELFTGRQTRDEPFVVERNQIAVRTELAEGALHHRRELRLAL